MIECPLTPLGPRVILQKLYRAERTEAGVLLPAGEDDRKLARLIKLPEYGTISEESDLAIWEQLTKAMKAGPTVVAYSRHAGATIDLGLDRSDKWIVVHLRDVQAILAESTVSTSTTETGDPLPVEEEATDE